MDEENVSKVVESMDYCIKTWDPRSTQELLRNLIIILMILNSGDRWYVYKLLSGSIKGYFGNGKVPWRRCHKI